MKRVQSLIIFLLLSLILIGLAVWAALFVKFPQQLINEKKEVVITDARVLFEPENWEKAVVKKVVDGDTIELENGQKVRYIGIDTPETKHPTKGIQCFGKEASKENKLLVEGKTIYMEKDVSNTDRYKRLLRYIYIQSPTASDEAIFINRLMVEQGYAHLLTYPPDVKYNEILLTAEKQAREQKKGLWSACPIEQ